LFQQVGDFFQQLSLGLLVLFVIMDDFRGGKEGQGTRTKAETPYAADPCLVFPGSRGFLGIFGTLVILLATLPSSNGN
jgi:hypothetical protein